VVFTAVKARPRAAWIMSTTSAKDGSSVATTTADVRGRSPPDFDELTLLARPAPADLRRLGRALTARNGEQEKAIRDISRWRVAVRSAPLGRAPRSAAARRCDAIDQLPPVGRTHPGADEGADDSPGADARKDAAFEPPRGVSEPLGRGLRCGRRCGRPPKGLSAAIRFRALSPRNGQGGVVYEQKDRATTYSASISLVGVPDEELPVLSLVSDGDVTDPFASFSLVASEPLPSGASPELMSATGDRFSLTTNSPPAFVVSFQSPATLRRFGEVYTIAIDGISDFAGNAAVPAATLGFTTKPAPPLVAPDGFESVVSDTLGGAQVLSGTGAPITAPDLTKIRRPASLCPVQVVVAGCSTSGRASMYAS
jgi:hypothetical protein